MARANGHSRSLTSVLGANCKQIRKDLGLTQDALAAYAYASGLRWNAAKVANFEAGRWTPTFADVLLLGVALERARPFAAIAAIGNPDPPTRVHREVRLADLLNADDEAVALKPGVVLTGAELTKIARGKPFPLRDSTTPPQPALAEQRLARALGIEHIQLVEMSQQLWGMTFTAERNRRAGAGNQQRKGRISRELRAELEKALTDGRT